MDNKEFIAKLAKKMNRDPKDVSSLMEGLAQVFKESLSNLESIAMPGFGEFCASKEDEIISVDHSSGKRYLLPPQISVLFKPSSIMKKRVTE